ncbi:unnamed protein product, partial [Symbiodinium microadriaticum]
MEREPQPSARLLFSADFRASFERAFDLEADIAAQRLEISRLHGRLRHLEVTVFDFHLEGAPLRSDPYQELDSTAATAVSDSARALSPTSDREKIEPISKMRRRWQLTSTKAPPTALLPMEDSPGSSGAASSWHMVAPIPAPHFDVESISDGEDPLAARGSDTLGPAVPSTAGKSLLECRGALAAKAVAFRAPRPLVKEAGFSRSKDLYDDLAQRNRLLFEQLCDLYFEISPVLGQITASRYSEVLRGKLLAKISDSTASRYLRSVQIFFTTFEELGGNIRQVETGLFLDTFFVLSRCPEEGPLSNSLNVMKALRWYRKLLGLSPFPDLYSAAFSSLVQPASGEKRESMPLPLSFHAFLERKVLDSDTPREEALWAGSFLACIGGSLRFSDAQHISWSSLCINHFTLRGICYRTKTTKRGAPFAFLGFGAYSSSREFGMNWLSAWILLLDSIWHGLRASFGCQKTPDCFFFTMGKQGFSPASYAQILLRLRNFLQESGMQPKQAANYTLHSLEVTMLSWMAQLDLPLPARQPSNQSQHLGGIRLIRLLSAWGTAAKSALQGSPLRDPTLSPFIAFATMSKTPFSADYIHKLLKTLPDSEKEKFLEMLAGQPVIDQQPASGQAGPKASASQPSPPAATPQTPPEFCDTVAQEAYTQPAPQAEHQGKLNVHHFLLQMLPLPELALYSLLQTGSMAAEFFSLMTESSIPDNIREALASYDTPLFARSCNDQEELASLISHLMEASDTSSVGDQILARASVRLLFSRCRESCGLPPLDDAKGNQQPESWPAKLSSERTAELR